MFTCDLKSAIADDTTSNWSLGASVTCVSVCKWESRGDLTWTLRKGQLGLTSCRSIAPSACCSVVFQEKLVWQSNLVNTNCLGANIIAIAQVCSISYVWLASTSIMHFSTLVPFDDFSPPSCKSPHFWQFPGKLRKLYIFLIVLHQKCLWLIHAYWNVKSFYSDGLSQDSWRPDACRR